MKREVELDSHAELDSLLPQVSTAAGCLDSVTLFRTAERVRAMLLYVHGDQSYRLFGTGSPGRPPRL